MEKISIVVPCYNEQEVLPLFYDEICRVSNDMTIKYDLEFEFVFVNDGSKDDTHSIVKKLSKEDSRVHYISFSRNFGKEAAIFAGLERTNGDYVCIMDADLQDPPLLVEEMYYDVKHNDFDCVATRRATRKGEPKIRSFFANCFYKLMNKISDTDIVSGARDFRLMNRNMVDGILKLKEYNRFSKGIFGWVGFNTKWISYDNVERAAGKTKWSFWKLFAYSLEGIFAFSTLPLAFSSILGMLICIAAFIYMVGVLIGTWIWGNPVDGYPSLVVIMLFACGIQLFSLGIIGQYISKLYMETKNRPIYIVREESKKIETDKNPDE